MKSFNKFLIFKKIKSLLIYVFDKEVPFLKKLFIVLGFVYLLFPFDIIPDTILGLGIIDDITIIFIIYKIFKNELEEYEYLKKK